MKEIKDTIEENWKFIGSTGAIATIANVTGIWSLTTSKLMTFYDNLNLVLSPIGAFLILLTVIGFQAFIGYRTLNWLIKRIKKGDSK